MSKLGHFTNAVFFDRWVEWITNALAVVVLISILVPAGSFAENVADWIGIALLAGVLARSIKIGWQLHRGRGLENDPAAVVQKRERIGNWFTAAFFFALAVLALRKLLL